MEDTTDIETAIFNRKFKEIILSNQDEQINFLKIYPLFNKNQNILLLWKQYYEELNNSTNITTEIQIKKDLMMDFLTFALEYDLIEYKTKEILTILTMMEYTDDQSNRDLIKSSIIKGKTNTCLKKISLIDDPHIYDKTINASIKDFSPYEIAQELTRKFSFLTEKISYHELLYVSQNDNKFNKNENKLITPIEVLINDFRKLGYIVFYTILIEDKTDIARVNTIKHILKICEELKSLNNYHALFALSAALNNSVIQKLDNLWKNKKYSMFAEFSDIVNPCNNYKNYRNLVKKNIKNNMILYIGITISDIKHILEYPLYDTSNNNFNVDVYTIILSILNNFKSVQLNYDINKNEPIYKWFSNINIQYSESEFYDTAITLKTNIHRQLIEQLAVENEHNKFNQQNIMDTISETSMNDPTMVRPASNNLRISYDSVEEIIKLTNIPQATRRNRHRSMPANIKKQTVEFKTWTINDVQNWLHTVDMSMYCDIFEHEEIDGSSLINLTNEILKTDMNIKKLGHRLKLLDAIKNISN